MRRQRHIPEILGGGVVALALVTWTATINAGNTLLQGPPSEDLVCEEGICTVSNNRKLIVEDDLQINGNLTSGSGSLRAIEVDPSSVDHLTWRIDCPEGYTRSRDMTYVTCERAVGPDRVDVVVKVGDFWIDKYEASIWSTSTCLGEPVGVNGDTFGARGDNGDWRDVSDVFACSLFGVAPSRYMTWFQAQQSCRASGKTLCTNAEWQAAAVGTPDDDATLPADDGFECHIWNGTKPAGAVWAGVTQYTVLTGSATRCVSKVGACDMIGNVSEWVADWFIGGQAREKVAVNDNTRVTYWPSTDYNGDGLWNVNGSARLTDTAGTFGLPAAAQRGGGWTDQAAAGAYNLYLVDAPGRSTVYSGTRCCLRR